MCSRWPSLSWSCGHRVNLSSELVPAPRGKCSGDLQRSGLSPAIPRCQSSPQAHGQDRTVMGAPAAWSLALGRGAVRADTLPGLAWPPWGGRNRSPVSAGRRLHLLVNSRRREATPPLRSEKVPG
ncbi:hypothetical protein mRhiFer1_010224 [Rhinolophus ferrumequinum]|uniref:Uncharacterized protein n=1 Tax=Rhinolophus ferrumequinum TaxID=59479 RepID=A0A7J7X600_RHIFE|nr:hypothetical protein mRhiFer1_010224 [Rhinolophus ferrumequinum]